MALMRPAEGGPMHHGAMFSLSIGGAESNVAIGLQRLGIDATWIGRLGNDSFGDLIIREIRGEGVRVSAVRDSLAPSGLMIKERRSQLDTRVWYYRAGLAGSRLCPADVDPDLIRSASLLHITGITLAISASASDAVFRAVEIAHQAGVTVSFDLNHRSSLWNVERARAAYRLMIPLADVVFASADEAALAVMGDDRSGTNVPHPPMDPHNERRPEASAVTEGLRLAHELVELGCGHAVVKLGAHGAVAISDGVEHFRPAIAVPVVDTVGAGDAFVAGYLAELLLGRAIDERLLTAVTTGAYACTVSGDWEGLPWRADLTALASGDPVRR